MCKIIQFEACNCQINNNNLKFFTCDPVTRVEAWKIAFKREKLQSSISDQNLKKEHMCPLPAPNCKS